MSARWRRSKRQTKRFNVLRALDRIKDKDTPQKFRIKPKIKKQAIPHRYRAPTTYKGKKCRELEPLVDVLEEKDEIVVVAELAGFQRENLRVYAKNQRLTLSAEASDHKYYKSLNLPKRVIPNNIRTKYKNGVLEIRLRKAVEEKTIDKVAD